MRISSKHCLLALGGALLASACSRELPIERAPAGRDPAVEIASATGASHGATQTAPNPAPALSSAHASTARGSGVAVVELFTSEGCSSCPPADRVLARLAARAQAGSLPVFPLSFHVDYWNYLGWRDRFSDRRYSERQQNYGALGGGGTYTPQAVINGEAECLGSDASRIDALIGSALKRAPRTQIALTAQRGERGIEVSYQVSGEVAASVLNLALVEPRAETAVERGENAGDRLQHVNVVRVFSTRPLSAGTVGTWVPGPVPDFQTLRVGVVAYVESTSQRDISGAAALEL